MLVAVSAWNHATDEQLYAGWQALNDARVNVECEMNRLREQWQHATDPGEAARLALDLDVYWKHFKILSAWTEVHHAAYVFATEGHESMFMR